MFESLARTFRASRICQNRNCVLANPPNGRSGFARTEIRFWQIRFENATTQFVSHNSEVGLGTALVIAVPLGGLWAGHSAREDALLRLGETGKEVPAMH